MCIRDSPYSQEAVDKIFDLKGRHVASLVDEIMHSGNHQVPWNPVALPSGVYLVDLNTGKKSFKQKITYIK